MDVEAGQRFEADDFARLQLDDRLVHHVHELLVEVADPLAPLFGRVARQLVAVELVGDVLGEVLDHQCIAISERRSVAMADRAHGSLQRAVRQAQWHTDVGADVQFTGDVEIADSGSVRASETNIGAGLTAMP